METSGCQFAGALNRLGDDRELFHELTSYFLEDAPKLISAIRKGLTRGSADEVARAAHSMRGLAANFDAQKVMTIGGSIEQMARKGTMQPVASALIDLEIELQLLLSALKEYTAQSPSPAAGK